MVVRGYRVSPESRGPVGACVSGQVNCRVLDQQWLRVNVVSLGQVTLVVLMV